MIKKHNTILFVYTSDIIKGILRIKNYNEIFKYKFEFIIHEKYPIDYYINNCDRLIEYHKILEDNGCVLSYINKNISGDNFNCKFKNKFYYLNIYPYNTISSIIYFKMCPNFIILSLQYNNNSLSIWLNSYLKECKYLVYPPSQSFINYSELEKKNIVICNPNNYLIRGSNIAILYIPDNIEKYLSLIGPKTRNMIKKCQQKEYYCKVVNPDEYLQDIYETNISKKVRSCGSMKKNYLQYPNKFNIIKENSNKKYKKIFYGIFIKNKLIGYSLLKFCNEIVVLEKVLGHGDHLKYGIMNLLFYFIVNYIIENESYVKYFNYLSIENNSLGKFKLHNGFKKCDYIIF